VNEKEANHPAHPMDRTANWCSHGGWFTLALGNQTQNRNWPTQVCLVILTALYFQVIDTTLVVDQ